MTIVNWKSCTENKNPICIEEEINPVNIVLTSSNTKQQSTVYKKQNT